MSAIVSVMRLERGGGIHMLQAGCSCVGVVAQSFDVSQHGGGRATGCVGAPSSSGAWGPGREAAAHAV